MLVSCLFLFSTAGHGATEWEVVNDLAIQETPLDIALSSDGKKVYVLAEKSILIYSHENNVITETIPLDGSYTRITASPDGEFVYLTDKSGKKISVIQLTAVYRLPVDNSPIIGKKDAPVSLVAFLDYQCPYCSRVYPLLEQILKKHSDDVKLVIKHYPLRMHRFARKASVYALAASRQNKYRELTALYLKQFKSLNAESLRSYAQEVGVDVPALEKDAKDPLIAKIMEMDVKLARDADVRGVPALFVNGRKVKVRSFDAISQMIAKEIAKK